MCHDGRVSATSPVEVDPTTTPDEVTVVAKPWVTVVWNDPVNLMCYVTYVFQKYFGYDKDKAEQLMLEVHQEDGRWSRPDAARRWSGTCRRCTSTVCGPRCRRTVRAGA